jgi:hypothetical protein
MEGLLRVGSFVAKLAGSSRLLKLAIAAGALLAFYVVRTGGSYWDIVVMALLVVGLIVGAHLLRARLSGDEDVWDTRATRRIDLPLSRETATAHVQRVLEARDDTSGVERHGFTITCSVPGRFPADWEVTASVRDRGPRASEVIIDVELCEEAADTALDFGTGHRIATSIEAGLKHGVVATQSV